MRIMKRFINQMMRRLGYVPLDDYNQAMENGDHWHVLYLEVLDLADKHLRRARKAEGRPTLRSLPIPPKP
jgi:hypothetical protein